jgi:ABC-type molybdate transport system permease subunit
MQSGNRELALKWTVVILSLSLISLVAINFITGIQYKDR